MKRLGYRQFVAQGGDWGAVIVDTMGLQAPPELLGIHTNMPGIFPADIDGAAFSGAPAPSGLSTDEKLAYERLQFVYQKGIGYGFQMGLRPQTLYGIADSPVGLAAYFLDHDARSYELISRVFQGQAEGLTRDDILDNITIPITPRDRIHSLGLDAKNELFKDSMGWKDIAHEVESTARQRTMLLPPLANGREETLGSELLERRAWYISRLQRP
jgi:hypothetical protein